MQPAVYIPVALVVTAPTTNDGSATRHGDGGLMARIASGDRAAAEQFVKTHQSAVRGFLRAVCYDREAVEDLAQDTFVRALSNAHRFDPKFPLRGWLLTIARRLSINHGNKAIRRRPQPGIELNTLQDASASAPDRSLQQHEQHELNRSAIEQAMQQLTEPQRTTLALHYQQGLPLIQIADLLGMRVGTVKSHLHRGRKRMRELLEPQAQRLMS